MADPTVVADLEAAVAARAVAEDAATAAELAAEEANTALTAAYNDRAAAAQEVERLLGLLV